MKLLIYLARLQGVYYFLTGIWPLLDLDSFMAVTGPKTDTWLVRTVGVLIAGIGLSFLVSQARQRVGYSTICLAISASLGLAVIDVVNSLTMRIPAIYLLDAFIQTVFLTAWLVASFRIKRSRNMHVHHEKAGR